MTLECPGLRHFILPFIAVRYIETERRKFLLSFIPTLFKSHVAKRKQVRWVHKSNNKEFVKSGYLFVEFYCVYNVVGTSVYL